MNVRSQPVSTHPMKFGLALASDDIVARDPRRRVLDAAIACFVRHGFHNASMQQICAEAGMSPGALYRYFPSKDSIIAAIAEADRQRHAEAFRRLSDAPNFIDALLALGRDLLADDDPANCAHIVPEVLAEMVRNPQMRALFKPSEEHSNATLRVAMEQAVARGELDPSLDLDAVSLVLHAIGDGLSTRLALDPSTNLEALMPTLETMMRRFLAPPAVTDVRHAEGARPDGADHAR